MRQMLSLVIGAFCAWGLFAMTVDVTTCGAVADGATDNTAAIQRAIDRCAGAGGGTALVPAGGAYVTYTLRLKSNVRLEIERGAVLLGGTDPFKYPLFEPTPLWHVERSPRFNRRAMFYTCGQTNVTLCGGGAIDGNAIAFHHQADDPEHWARNSHTNITGRCVFFVACRDVTVRDVTIRNPAGWSTWFLDCDRVDIRNLTISADPRFPNGDGIHLGACRDVTISDCVVHSQDDALILRAHQEQCREPRPLERVLVNNCVLDSRRCATVRIGWCGDAPVRDCTLNNIISRDTSLGVEIWIPKHNNEGQIDPPRSAELTEPPGMLPFAIENIRFSNMDMECRRGPFAVNIAREVRPQCVRNISFSHCRFKCAQSPKIGKGARAKDQLSDWSFDNVEFDIAGNAEETDCPWFTDIRNLRLNNIVWNVHTKPPKRGKNSICAASPELLFHAPFDGSPVARTAKGVAQPLAAENLAYAPGKVGKAVRISAAARARLEYALKGNLDMRRGAVALWVKREWTDANAALYHALLSTAFPEDRLGTGAISFWFLHGVLRADVSDFGDNHFTRTVGAAKGQWEHLVLNWDGSDIGIAVNGRLVKHYPGPAASAEDRDAIEAASFKRRAFDRIFVGSREGLFLFDGLIDELMIFSEPLDEAAIRKIFERHATDEERAVERRPDYAKAFAERPINPYVGKPSNAAEPPMNLSPVETVELTAAGVAKLTAASRFKAIGGTAFKTLGDRAYLEAGENGNSRFAVRFALDAAAPLHLFEIEYPDDKTRTMDLIVQDSRNEKWDGTPGADYTLQVGVLTGGLAPISGKMMTHRCVYWTRASDVTLCAMTARHGQPAAISRIKVWKIADGKLPPLDVARPKASGGWHRQLAMYFEDPAISYGFPLPDHGTSAVGMRELVQRTAATMKFAGETMLVYPGAWYHGYMDDSYNPRSHAPDFLSAWYEGFDREGLEFIPTINLWQIPYRGRPITPETAKDGSLHNTAVSILDTGMPKLGGAHGTNPTYNILHPATQAHLEFIVDSMLAQGADHPSFKGICIHFGRTTITTFGSAESGYNDYAIAAFEKACGVRVAVDRNNPLRGKLYAAWLRARPDLYQKWLTWRCQMLAAFWGRIARKMAARRGDLKLWFNCYPMTAVTRKEFLNDDFAREMIRDAGVDADILVREAKNIVVSPCLVPGDYRWRNAASMPADRRDERMAKDRDSYKLPVSYAFCAKDETYPWNALHDVYWESPVGGDGSVCGHGKAAKDEVSLNSAWLRECRWRVTTLNPSGRNALAHLVAPLGIRDVLGVSKGGFLIGTYGMEGPMREFSAAFQALPAVRMTEFFRQGPVVAREVRHEGRRYYYLVNAGAEVETLEFDFPAGSHDLTTGERKGGKERVTLRPYQLRSFAAP